MTGVPVELCGQIWYAQVQSAAFEQSITGKDKTCITRYVVIHPASGHLAEHWHAWVDDEAEAHATDQTQLQMLKQWRLLLPQGLPWNVPRVPQACLIHTSVCSVASAI